MIKANYKDKDAIIDILCSSFDANNSVNYVVKQDKHRKKRIRRLMEYSFDLCYQFGRIYFSENKLGCALLLFPDQKKKSLKTILLDLKLALLCIGISRVSTVLNRDSRIKSYYPQQPLYYVWFLGVKENEQQKGTGSQLLSELIKESQHLKKPLYLETSMPENIRFYTKFGFEVYQKLDFGHTLFLLKRDISIN
jgi:hypothetical protein